jgi:hypothetical protein
MTDRTLYSYDYVNHPYTRVRDLVLANPHHVFQHATAAATTEAAALHVRLGGVDIGKDVAIKVTGVEHDPAYDRPATSVLLEWEATSNPRMFPSMKASLVIFPLSATETQLELRGAYEPPLGKLGEVLDAAAGHRLAQASVTRFIQEIAGWLREQLANAPTVDPLPQPANAPTVDPRPQPSQPPVVDMEC